jgi:hypothetical protein
VRRISMLIVALVLAHTALLILAIRFPRAVPSRTRSILAVDVGRFHQIAVHRGRPYRDFEVEYPPLSVLATDALTRTRQGSAARVGVVSLAAELGVAGLLLFKLGQTAAALYLALGLPLALVTPFRFDLLSVLLAVLGIVLVRDRIEVGGGVALALAVLFKIWPMVLLPWLVVRRRWKAVGWSLGSLAGATGVWVVWAGIDAPVQVLTARHARGWQVESSIGSFLRVVLRWPQHFISGAWRVGSFPPGVAALLILCTAMVAFVAARWAAPAGDDIGMLGLAATTSVGGLLLLAPVLSPQYVSWLVPWAAIAAVSGVPEAGWLVGTVSLLTGLMWTIPGHGVFGALLGLRNAALLATILYGLLRLHGARLAVGDSRCRGGAPNRSREAADDGPVSRAGG